MANPIPILVLGLALSLGCTPEGPHGEAAAAAPAPATAPDVDTAVIEPTAPTATPAPTATLAQPAPGPVIVDTGREPDPDHWRTPAGVLAETQAWATTRTPDAGPVPVWESEALPWSERLRVEREVEPLPREVDVTGSRARHRLELSLPLAGDLSLQSGVDVQTRQGSGAPQRHVGGRAGVEFRF